MVFAHVHLHSRHTCNNAPQNSVPHTRTLFIKNC